MVSKCQCDQAGLARLSLFSPTVDLSTHVICSLVSFKLWGLSDLPSNQPSKPVQACDKFFFRLACKCRAICRAIHLQANRRHASSAVGLLQTALTACKSGAGHSQLDPQESSTAYPGVILKV